MKRTVIIVLVLVVIGIGFYLGYNKANDSQKTAFQENNTTPETQVSQSDANVSTDTTSDALSESKVVQAYREAQTKTPFLTNPYAGSVAALNIATSWEEFLSVYPRNIQVMTPIAVKGFDKINYTLQKAMDEQLRKQIVKIDMPKNPISNSVAFIYYTEPSETQIGMDLFLYEDDMWKNCGINNMMSAVNHNEAISKVEKMGLVIKDYQLVDDSQFQKIIAQALKANK
jgi:hypothetical protein